MMVQKELLAIHAPIAPARECAPGEGIYLELWQDYVAARPQEAALIFNCEDIEEVPQRKASIAASFMTYMGCSCGRAFTDQAERFAEIMGLGRECAFLAAWTLKNQRRLGINSNVRTIERMLAEPHPVFRVPAITMSDIDFVEEMVRWWATHAARVMRHIAEPLIEAEIRKRSSSLYEREQTS